MTNDENWPTSSYLLVRAIGAHEKYRRGLRRSTDRISARYTQIHPKIADASPLDGPASRGRRAVRPAVAENGSRAVPGSPLDALDAAANALHSECVIQ